MARYTLRSYCGGKLLERFDHRSATKLRSILTHPRHHRGGQTDPFGEIEQHADKFEIIDSHQKKLFLGNIEDALKYVSGLK